MSIDYQAPVDELPVGCVASHFLDSGAFTHWGKATAYAKEHGVHSDDYYNTEEFWEYMDAYAQFIKKHRVAIDLYANLDVIPNPKLTWRNQQWLEEEYGLLPVPVVHYRTNLKWLKFYVDRGYEIIGLGGLVGSSDQLGCRNWIDKAFEIVCDTPDRLPRVKLHAFGVTSHELLVKYPWYSVDSAAWTKVASFGGILMPRYIHGQWRFERPPYVIKVSEDAPDRKKLDKHVLTFSEGKSAKIKEWLKEINVPLGKKENGEVVEWGVTTHHTYRKVANLLFYERLREYLPDYPWPFESSRIKGILE